MFPSLQVLTRPVLGLDTLQGHQSSRGAAAETGFACAHVRGGWQLVPYLSSAQLAPATAWHSLLLLLLLLPPQHQWGCQICHWQSPSCLILSLMQGQEQRVLCFGDLWGPPSPAPHFPSLSSVSLAQVRHSPGHSWAPLSLLLSAPEGWEEATASREKGEGKGDSCKSE